jgi:hypothetical protein
MNERSKLPSPPRPELILFLACVAITIAPLALRGTSCGQDFDFHLQSWMEASLHWRQGIFYPHWLASANYQTGEPRFVFYPPLSWTLGGILGTIFPWTWTPILFVTTCLLAIGVACYKMTCEWMTPADAASTACLYIVNPYIFFVIFERSACAELLAAALFPLLILYALRDKPSTPQLALTVGGLWLTNAPAAVMGSYALAIIALVAAISQRRWTLVFRAAAAMPLGLGLAAVYIIPAAYEQRWVEIARAIMPGMRVQDSFLYEHTGQAYHDLVLHTASWIATLMLVATLFAAIASLLARKSLPVQTRLASKPATIGSGHAKQLPGRLVLPLIALGAVIAFLLFPISKIIWYIGPELRFLQFPWRWLLVLGLIFAVLATTALSGLISARRYKILFAAVLLAAATVLCVHAWRHFWLECDYEDNVRAQIETLHESGFHGTDEYTPDHADPGDIQQNLAPVRVVSSDDGDEGDSSIQQNPDWQPNMDELQPAIVQIRRWQLEHMTAEVQITEPGYALFRLMDYPAWRVRVNKNLVSNRPRRDDGLLIVPVPAGASTIDVQYSTTPDMWAGRIITLIALIVWLALAAKTSSKQVS